MYKRVKVFSLIHINIGIIRFHFDYKTQAPVLILSQTETAQTGTSFDSKSVGLAMLLYSAHFACWKKIPICTYVLFTVKLYL